MPDVSHNGRELNYVSPNMIIRYKKTDGTIVEVKKADLLGDTALQTEILSKMGIATTTIQGIETDYTKDGSQNPLDTDSGIWTQTWTTPGKKLAYDSTNYNTGVFLDTGATP